MLVFLDTLPEQQQVRQLSKIQQLQAQLQLRTLLVDLPVELIMLLFGIV